MPITYEDALQLTKDARQAYDSQFATGHSRRRQLKASEREKLGALVISYLSTVAELYDNPNPHVADLYTADFLTNTIAGPVEVAFNIGSGYIVHHFQDESKFGLLGHGLANGFDKRTGTWFIHPDRSKSASENYENWLSQFEKLFESPTPLIDNQGHDLRAVKRHFDRAARLHLVGEAESHRHFEETIAQFPLADWTMFEEVLVLRAGNSRFVAVPLNGKKSSPSFDVIDVTNRKLIVRLLKSEVRNWLWRASQNEEAVAQGLD